MSGQNRTEATPGHRAGEFDLIARYFAPLAGPGAFGLGDDAAVYKPTAGCELVFTADAIISGVHFLADDPPGDVAAKLLAVNLSDLAAMGSVPVGYLITTAWPRQLDENWIAEFAKGLGEAQTRFATKLLGGDTVATDGPLCLSLTAIGELPAGTALRRNGARPGDAIYISGRIGDAGVGLHILRDGLAGGTEVDREVTIRRYRRPEPRLSLGPALCGLVSACIDVSDGLLADLGHIAEQSSVKMTIELDQVPLSPLAGLIGGAVTAIVCGDDYELLFTAGPAHASKLQEIAGQTGTQITRIGTVGDGAGVVVIDAQGNEVTLERPGYRHF